MNKNVSTFLEENVTLLDQNMLEFFMNMYHSSLKFSNCREIAYILGEAGIDYQYTRFEAFDKIVLDMLEELSQEENKRDTLVVDFISLLGNRLGLNTLESKKYILANADRWDNLIEIYINDSYIPVISWR